MTRPSIRSLGAGERSLAVEILARSFRDYPVMRFILRGEREGDGRGYDALLRALVGFYCDTRLERGFPVLALSDGAEVVAVTLLNPPHPDPWPPILQRKQQELREVLGAEAMARMITFEAESDRGEPEYPHFFVGMIGVRPRHQGRGHGRRLLEHVRELSRRHPRSEAVCLTTEDPANVPFYRHLGFEVLREADVGPLRTWSLALPTKRS